MSDDDLPTAPIAFRAYARLRMALTPEQTFRYIGVETISVGFLTGLLFYFLLGAIAPEVILVSILGYTAIFAVHAILISPDKRNKEREVINITPQTTLLLAIVGTLPFIGHYLITGETALISGAVPVLAVYVASVYYRGEKHEGERSFFINEDSESRSDWYEGSVAFEQALDHSDMGNEWQTFYWSIRAERAYESVIENENRYALRRAASHLSTAARFLSVTTFINDIDKKAMYFDAIEQSFERTGEWLNERICDSCGQQTPLENARRVQVEDGERVYCSQCQYDSQDEPGTNDSEQKTASQHRTEDKMPVEKACDILDISQPIDDEDTVHKAYRDKVTKVHPDTGGSSEAFKKVKNARERLVQYVD